MATNKTQATAADPAAYVAAIDDDERRRDCETLARMMAKASKRDATMWGPGIVGFGTHVYPLAGGKSGEICAVGFSSRKGDISIYGVEPDAADPALVAKLGKHKFGKGCLYVRRLADVDTGVLQKLFDHAARSRQSRA